MRAALVGAAASSVALALPVAASVKPATAEPLLPDDRLQSIRPYLPSAINKAIADHKRALQAFNDCCDAADRMSPNYEGAKAEARWARFSRAEDRAMVALLATAPMSTAEAKAKRRYLLPFCDDLQPHHVAALLYA